MKLLKYVCGMSKSAKDIRKSLSGKSEGIVTHLMRLYKYPENSSVNHWRGEVFNFINSVPTVKGYSRFPQPQWLADVIWDNIDYNDISMWERGMVSKYGPGSKLNTIEFYDICRNYINWLSTQLSHTGEVSRCEVYAKLEELGL